MKKPFQHISEWHLLQGIEDYSFHLFQVEEQEEYLNLLSQWKPETKWDAQWMMQIAASIVSGKLSWSKKQLQAGKPLEEWALEVIDAGNLYFQKKTKTAAFSKEAKSFFREHSKEIEQTATYSKNQQLGGANVLLESIRRYNHQIVSEPSLIGFVMIKKTDHPNLLVNLVRSQKVRVVSLKIGTTIELYLKNLCNSDLEFQIEKGQVFEHSRLDYKCQSVVSCKKHSGTIPAKQFASVQIKAQGIYPSQKLPNKSSGRLTLFRYNPMLRKQNAKQLHIKVEEFNSNPNRQRQAARDALILKSAGRYRSPQERRLEMIGFILGVIGSIVGVILMASLR